MSSARSGGRFFNDGTTSSRTQSAICFGHRAAHDRGRQHRDFALIRQDHAVHLHGVGGAAFAGADQDRQRLERRRFWQAATGRPTALPASRPRRSFGQRGIELPAAARNCCGMTTGNGFSARWRAMRRFLTAGAPVCRFAPQPSPVALNTTAIDDGPFHAGNLRQYRRVSAAVRALATALCLGHLPPVLQAPAPRRAPPAAATEVASPVRVE